MVEMDIEFVGQSGEELMLMSGVTYLPFKEGDIIELILTNENPDIWNVVDHRGAYEVLKIGISYGIRYPKIENIRHIRYSCHATVSVKEL